MIKYSTQTIKSDDKKLVSKVLNSQFLTQGPINEKFSGQLKKLTGAKHCLTVNSATSALYLAVKALKLKKNDLFWTVPNSFVATANCGILNNLKIDFVDIDPEDWNISITKLKEKLKKSKIKPKLVITVHLAGTPTKAKEIFQLSKKYNFKIIEDASHSIGAKYDKKNKVGNCKWSDITVFSFHPVKIITTAEGGACLTNNKIIFDNLRLTHNNGIEKNSRNFKFKNLGGWYYEQQDIGFNFRMNELQAALGVSQLKKINIFVKKRNRIANNYKNQLKHLPIRFQKIYPNTFSSYHLFIIQLLIGGERLHKRLFDFMRKNKIFVNVHYLPIHLHPFYRRKGFKKNQFPNSENYSKSAISIPIYPNLKSHEQKKVIKLIKRFLNDI